jgi:hypothetical protein
MFQLHVVLDQAKSWFDYFQPCITAVAALGTLLVALRIARNQNKLQAELAKMQLAQQERQLKKDLFDRRFAVYVNVLDFVSYVLQENGKIQLAGPGKYRDFWESMEKAEMLFGADVNEYLADVDKTARDFYVSAQRMDKTIATGDVEAIDRNAQLLERLYKHHAVATEESGFSPVLGPLTLLLHIRSANFTV